MRFDKAIKMYVCCINIDKTTIRKKRHFCCININKTTEWRRGKKYYFCCINIDKTTKWGKCTPFAQLMVKQPNGELKNKNNKNVGCIQKSGIERGEKDNRWTKQKKDIGIMKTIMKTITIAQRKI